MISSHFDVVEQRDRRTDTGRRLVPRLHTGRSGSISAVVATHLFGLLDGQDESQTKSAFEVLERHQTAQNGSSPQRVTAAGLDGLRLRSAASE